MSYFYSAQSTHHTLQIFGLKSQGRTPQLKITVEYFLRAFPIVLTHFEGDFARSWIEFGWQYIFVCDIIILIIIALIKRITQLWKVLDQDLVSVSLKIFFSSAANPPRHSFAISIKYHMALRLQTSRKLCSSPSFQPKTSKDEGAKSLRNSHCVSLAAGRKLFHSCSNMLMLEARHKS